RSFSCPFIACERPLQFIRNHVEGLVGSDQPQIFTSNSQQSHSFRNGHVHFFRSIDRTSRRVSLFIGWSLGFAGDRQSHQVGGGTTSSKTAREFLAVQRLA